MPWRTASNPTRGLSASISPKTATTLFACEAATLAQRSVLEILDTHEGQPQEAEAITRTLRSTLVDLFARRALRWGGLRVQPGCLILRRQDYGHPVRVVLYSERLFTMTSLYRAFPNRCNLLGRNPWVLCVPPAHALWIPHTRNRCKDWMAAQALHTAMRSSWWRSLPTSGSLDKTPLYEQRLIRAHDRQIDVMQTTFESLVH
jgi:hypothetical protein